MKAPEWLKGMFKELIPELLAEFIGIQSIRKLLGKSREKADEAAQTASNEKEHRDAEIKRGGLFDTSDETNFFSLLGKIEQCPTGGKSCVAKIAALLNSFPHEWQRRRFRVAVGYLNVDYDIKEIRGYDEEHWPNGKLKNKKEKILEKSSTRNIGVQFLISLAQYSHKQMREICESSGILHSDFEALKQAWERLTAWADTKGPEFLKTVQAARAEVQGSSFYKQPTPKTPYKRNFLRELFGL